MRKDVIIGTLAIAGLGIAAMIVLGINGTILTGLVGGIIFLITREIYKK